MHGWTSSHAVYDKPIEALKGHARCISYDHRGHGKSKYANGEHVTVGTLATDLYEMLVGLRLDEVTLVGWSMGAAVAMDYLSRFGTERLRQVILCDMTPRQVNDDEWHLGLYQGAYTEDDTDREGDRPFFDTYRAFAVAAKPSLRRIPGFLLHRPLRKIIEACDERVLAELSASMRGADYRHFADGLDVPLSYFFAAPGSLFSPDLADWYAGHVPTEFHAARFEGATHMLIDEQPERFAAEVAALLF